MKVFTSLVQVQEDGAILKPDTIEYRGALGFVVEWLVCQDEKWRMPAKIVRMDLLHHKATPELAHADFVVNEPVPRDAILGLVQPPEDPRLEVIENPDIRFPLETVH